jgi:hypothetical protein
MQLPDTSALEALHKEWPVITAAPYAFFSSLGILLFVGLGVIWLLFQGRLTRYRETVDHLERDVARLEKQLGSQAESQSTITPPTTPLLEKSPKTDEVSIVAVKLTPSEGPGTRMLLAVQNLGPKQRFRAQCRVIDRRNDPNPTRKVVVNLQWEVEGIKDMTILPHESRNLVIAEADHDSQIEWMRILGVSEQPESIWALGQRDNRPEYDLDISVFGDKSDAPHVEQFTLRSGTHSALEMFKRYLAITDPKSGAEVGYRHDVSGTVGPPNADVHVWVYAGKMWHSNGHATVTGSTWHRECYFGNKDSPVGGEFPVVAIANGNIREDKLTGLPDVGTRSNEIQGQTK